MVPFGVIVTDADEIGGYGDSVTDEDIRCAGRNRGEKSGG